MIYLVTTQQQLFENDAYTLMTVQESLQMMDSWGVVQFDSETTGRDAIIALSGVTSYNILLLAESRFAVWIFERVTGKDTSDNKGPKDGMDDNLQR